MSLHQTAALLSALGNAAYTYIYDIFIYVCIYVFQILKEYLNFHILAKLCINSLRILHFPVFHLLIPIFDGVCF